MCKREKRISAIQSMIATAEKRTYIEKLSSEWALTWQRHRHHEQLCAVNVESFSFTVRSKHVDEKRNNYWKILMHFSQTLSTNECRENTFFVQYVDVLHHSEHSWLVIDKAKNADIERGCRWNVLADACGWPKLQAPTGNTRELAKKIVLAWFTHFSVQDPNKTVNANMEEIPEIPSA